ncbi:MAG: hypothetical protein ACRDZY_01210 [Acidimicrobiales bacterium]
MSTATPNALEQLRARLVPGVQIVCVANTYIPARAGHTVTLTRVGRSQAVGQWSMNDGQVYVTLPVRVGDVTWVDKDTARWPLNNPAKPLKRLEGHTVTYRIQNPS